MSYITLHHSGVYNNKEHFTISGSKSISQRALIINYLSDFNIDINNLSDSDDTLVLYNALYSKKKVFDLQQSGTALRFLMSVFSLENKSVVLTGQDSLFQRPIEPLIDLLKFLGASIYKEKNNIHIQTGSMCGSILNLDAAYTTQFISSLLLISPYLKNGLTLNLPAALYSKSYIEMTISMMRDCGAKIEFKDHVIKVSRQPYTSYFQNIESDWTSLSYLFAAFVFSSLDKIFINNFYVDSIQYDKVLVDVFSLLGVTTHFEKNRIILEKNKNIVLPQKIEWNFIENPDLFPTIIVVCFGLGIELFATGLMTLSYKESNRLKTMKMELLKFNCIYNIESRDVVSMKPKLNNNILNELIIIDTHNDHRIALSFAPLVLLGWKLKIRNPEVINKSYRNFWHDLRKFGIEIKRL